MSGTKIPCPTPLKRTEADGELSGDDDGCCCCCCTCCCNIAAASGPELLSGLPGDGGLRPGGLRDGLGPDAIPCCPKTSAMANRRGSGSLARSNPTRIARAAYGRGCDRNSRRPITASPVPRTRKLSAARREPWLQVDAPSWAVAAPALDSLSVRLAGYAFAQGCNAPTSRHRTRSPPRALLRPRCAGSLALAATTCAGAPVRESLNISS